MTAFLKKLAGCSAALPPLPGKSAILLAGLGGLIATAILASMLEYAALPLVLGSFGASCVLIFGYPDAPFSQPRNIVLGHLSSSFFGLLCLTLLGAHWWSVALAVCLSIMVMMFTRTVHPPAGSNPVIVYLAHPGWGFLLMPTLLGALLLVVIALLYHNVSREKAWPQYW